MTAPIPGWLAPLTAQLADPAATESVVRLRPGRGARPAAVLALLGGSSLDDATVLVVERAHTLRHHPGQLAFPGGAVDATDDSLAAAALREGEEETGLDPGGVRVLGMLPAAHVSVSGFDVSAVVGWWHTPGPVGVNDPREVAQVITVPLQAAVAPERRVTVRHGSGYTGPAFWVTDDGGEELLIWGLTAHLLDGIIDLAGWTVPWDRDRAIEVPPRFLRDRAARVARGGPNDLH